MNTDRSIEEIEISIKEAQEVIEISEALKRLEQNKDFQKVVMKDYLKNEAIRLVHAKADPATQTEDIQKDIVKQIDAIGSFMSYLRKTHYQAMQAMKAIEADNETRNELLQEGLIDG